MNYVITGANRGIGLALCQQLVQQQQTVIAVCRQSSEALNQLAVDVITGIDVEQDASMTVLGQQLSQRNPSIHRLIHCPSPVAWDRSMIMARAVVMVIACQKRH